MENGATAGAFPRHLPPGRATVGGFGVCVESMSAAIEGATCRVRATLREIVDGRKLRFDVEVTEGERTIGIGTGHRVIQVDQLDSPPA